jgi:hypothetical protein
MEYSAPLISKKAYYNLLSENDANLISLKCQEKNKGKK